VPESYTVPESYIVPELLYPFNIKGSAIENTKFFLILEWYYYRRSRIGEFLGIDVFVILKI
jgi:hypothetical protein